eukprot:4564778-Ditylum_brightwellii.AAC.1
MGRGVVHLQFCDKAKYYALKSTRLNSTRALQCFGMSGSELQPHQGTHGKRPKNLKKPIPGKGIKKVIEKAVARHIKEIMSKNTRGCCAY